MVSIHWSSVAYDRLLFVCSRLFELFHAQSSCILSWCQERTSALVHGLKGKRISVMVLQLDNVGCPGLKMGERSTGMTFSLHPPLHFLFPLLLTHLLFGVRGSETRMIKLTWTGWLFGLVQLCLRVQPVLVFKAVLFKPCAGSWDWMSALLMFKYGLNSQLLYRKKCFVFGLGLGHWISCRPVLFY